MVGRLRLFRLSRGWLKAIAALLVLLGILVAAIAYLASRPPGLLSEMTHVEVTDEAAQSFDAKVDDFEQQLAGLPSDQTARLVLTQQEVTSKWAQLVEEEPTEPPVSDLQINFLEDTLLASFSVATPLGHMTVAFKADMEIAERELKVIIQKTYLGGLSLSGPIEDEVNHLIEEGTDLSWIELPQNTESVSLEDGVLVLEARGEAPLGSTQHLSIQKMMLERWLKRVVSKMT